MRQNAWEFHSFPEKQGQSEVNIGDQMTDDLLWGEGSNQFPLDAEV